MPDPANPRGHIVNLARSLATLAEERGEMKTRFWSLILLAALVVAALSGCARAAATTVAPTRAAAQPTQAPAPTEVPAPEATLRIWADDTRTPILQDLAEQFLADYNVELVVEDLGRVQDIRSQAIIAVPAGEGPPTYITGPTTHG